MPTAIFHRWPGSRSPIWRRFSYVPTTDSWHTEKQGIGRAISLIGIELPNPIREKVYLRGLLVALDVWLCQAARKAATRPSARQDLPTLSPIGVRGSCAGRFALWSCWQLTALAPWSLLRSIKRDVCEQPHRAELGIGDP
jgi:hypothetical protein